MPKANKERREPASDTVKDRFCRTVLQSLGADECPALDAPLSVLEQNGTCDSLDIIELVMDCEREFSIAVTDEELGELRSIGELWAIVERKAGTNMPSPAPETVS